MVRVELWKVKHGVNNYIKKKNQLDEMRMTVDTWQVNKEGKKKGQTY